MSRAGRAGRLFLGVDGGATKTVALVADDSGRVLGAARGRSSDIHAFRDPEVPLGHVAGAVREAAAAAGVTTDRLGPAAFSLCGADWHEDIELYQVELRTRLGLAEPPIVVNDAIGALRAGTSDGLGVSVVIGTGSAIGARGPGGPAGQSWHLGFWGEPAGGVELGRQALVAMVRAELGLGPTISVTPAALERFGAGTVEDLLHMVTAREGLGQEGLAQLAPILLDAGHTGDPVAAGIVAEHASLLSGYAAVAARLVGLRDGYPVVLSGGVLRHRCSDLIDGIARGLPGARIVRSAVEPAFGALLLAYDEAGVSVDAKRLRSSRLAPELFRTI